MPDAPSTRIDTADVLAVDDAVLRSSGAPDFGVTRDGFVAKPFARLLAEKLALARALFGDDLDLGSGSAVRKLLEVSALEDARTWAALATMYDDAFVVSASGQALGRLGDELGLPRPFLEAAGHVTLRLQGDLPAGFDAVPIPRGARMLTGGGHHVATDEAVTLSATSRQRDVAVVAFYPGPEHNLDPAAAAADGSFPQRIDRFNPLDGKLAALAAVREASGGALDVLIEHSVPLTGGELQWPDARYRTLLLRAPRSVWTAEAIGIAASLAPGVRQVQVRDASGGLDVNQSIFGTFSFVERVFASDRDLGSPYYLTVLVAPTPGAIVEGPDGLRASVESAVEDLRPISIFPRVQIADQVAVGVSAKLVVSGLPLPPGPAATVNDSGVARTLKARLLERVRRYVESLDFGEPVRAAEVTWTLMNEPGVVDVRDLALLAFPPRRLADVDLGAPPTPQRFDRGSNVELQASEIAVLVDDAAGLVII